MGGSRSGGSEDREEKKIPTYADQLKKHKYVILKQISLQIGINSTFNININNYK